MKLYRYEIEYSSIDDSETKVNLIEYSVFRETEHTYFVGIQYQTHIFSSKKLRRVSKNAYNAFAYDSKEKAMEHFIRRTNKRIGWYKYWIKECEKALEIAKKLAGNAL